MAEPLQGTPSAANAIARVKYTHDAMIDLLIANPGIPQGKIAEHFGYTQTWVSRIFNSDAFQARLALRKEELVDPTILATIEEKFKTLAAKSLDVVIERLHTAPSVDVALKGLDIASKALGYGARQQNVSVQQNFVVALPQKATSAAEWAESHGGGQGEVIDMTDKGA